MNTINRRAVLVVPAWEPGRGGGHLIRCMALVRGLRALGRESRLYLPPAAHELANVHNFLDSAGFDRSWLLAETDLHNENWECIVLDRFQTSPEELERWMRLAPVIGIDEGGPSRNYFDFLIDILPNTERTLPNIIDTSLLPLPKKPQSKAITPTTPLKVLVSFGQEDPAGLGIATAEALAAKNSNVVLEITLLHGELRKPSPSTPPPFPNLSEHLNEYDLVITHYGLTAFEALYASVPVLLVSPGGYHEKLAKRAGFYSLGIGKTGAKKLPGLLLRKGAINGEFLAALRNSCTALAEKHRLDNAARRSLAELINGFSPIVSRNCPVCGGLLHGPVLARFPERSYHRCKQCGIISMNRLNTPPIEYGREYFFERYQEQYGKTYIEDFPNLMAMAKRRLSVIKSLLPCNSNGAPLLLDIGCAYGPFLAAAKEEGFSPQGIDPAEDAVRYVTQTFGIPAAQGTFPVHYQLPTNHSLFSVITLWYVIEHFQDCVPALAEITKLLKPGGVLAFATPSFSGVSGRRSLKRFLEHSPADHWTLWSTATCKKALSIAGFTVKKTINSGHHPERFPLLGKFTKSTKSPLYGILLAVSKIFALGDTFEVYASVGESTNEERVPTN
jgi:2-polyprenyl-3-methyl-5-hydroxy-6-metoxy-1,4-benzoquinol methylase/spore coat polysaccharide biosynthesis predicted glycosyltransferase SpsG